MTYLRGVLTFESKLEIVYNLSSPVQCWALPYCAGTNPAPPSTLGNTFKIMNTAKTPPKSTNFILKLFSNADSFRNWTTSYFSRRGWVVEIFEDETNYALLHGITDKLSNFLFLWFVHIWATRVDQVLAVLTPVAVLPPVAALHMMKFAYYFVAKFQSLRIIEGNMS